jgi:hypothetical protein
MSGDGMGDVTPERLAALADGATPETEAERAAVALKAEVRGAAEPAPEAIRARVRGIAAREAREGSGWRRWIATPDGRRRLALAGAPVAAVVALAIAIPALTGDDDGPAPPPAADAPAAAEGATANAPRAAAPAPQSAAPAPPTAGGSTASDAVRAAEPEPALESAELQRAVARARATLREAGATDVRVREAEDGASAAVLASIPADTLEEATQELRDQGAQVAVGGGEAPDSEGDTSANIQATVTADDGG